MKAKREAGKGRGNACRGDANPSRLVWGSDWPHVTAKGPMPNDGDLLDLLADWVPDSALRRRVLVDNPAALYGF